MPHSSGGGSSSGGSHGGSSGESSSPRFGSRYYSGSRRYVYYVNSHPRYYFSDTPYTEETARSEKRSQIISGLAILLFTVVAAYMLSPSVVHIFHKVTVDYDPTVIIEDDMDVLTDQEESELSACFEKFTDLTGVTPAFHSIDLTSWRSMNDDLETYAYRRYLNMFDDEKHWLIVFSSDGDRETWQWEGMIGDDCESAISSKTEAALTSSLQDNLWTSSDYTVSEAMIESFDSISRDIDKISFNMEEALPLVFVLAFGCMGVFQLFKALTKNYKNDPRLSSFRCTTNKEAPLEDQCEYCGGVYVHGIHYSCPHCGAAIKAISEPYGQ